MIRDKLCLIELNFSRKKFIFNRIFEQNLYSRDTVEKGKSLIVADITFDRDKKFYSENEIIKITKDQLKSLKYINMDKLISITVEKIEYAMFLLN